MRPVHLVCFLFLLAALGTAHAAPAPVQEAALRTRVDLQRRTFAVFGAPTETASEGWGNATKVVPRSAREPAVLSTGNHPAARSVAQQAFTSSLR